MLPKRRSVLIALLAGLLLSFCVTWVSTGFESFQGWGSFLAVGIVGTGLLFLGWRFIRNEAPPQWLGWLTLGAVILRLGMGVLWFVGLPRWGYGTQGELAGYVMSDAYSRDVTAWELSQSGKPLVTAFGDYRLADQYGGLLFLSAAVYRYLGAEMHQPLLIVFVAAIVSGLAVTFTWAFTRRLWGERVARVAAWSLCFYPEAVLLGSSQMREAFTVTFAAAAIYGLFRYWSDRDWQGLVWIFGALLVSVPISYLFAVLMAGMLVLIGLALNRGQILRHWELWLALVLMLLVGLGAIWAFGDRILPEGAANPLDALRQWLKYAAKWEVRNATILSGWIDKIFARSPDWMHRWIILGYGTLQPFLPAALIAKGNPMWRFMALWRSVGWTALLFFLIYAPLRAARNLRKHPVAFGMSLVVWIGILLSAYRGGGDQWDNPRYRVIFAALQVGLGAWAWVQYRKESDPWLRRILVGMGLVFAWFIPWYLRRYFPITWPVVDLFKTVGLGLVSAVLYWVWDWARGERMPDEG